jgi:hypothetical protein
MVPEVSIRLGFLHLPPSLPPPPPSLLTDPCTQTHLFRSVGARLLVATSTHPSPRSTSNKPLRATALKGSLTCREGGGGGEGGGKDAAGGWGLAIVMAAKLPN